MSIQPLPEDYEQDPDEDLEVVAITINFSALSGSATNRALILNVFYDHSSKLNLKLILIFKVLNPNQSSLTSLPAIQPWTEPGLMLLLLA